ncbi:GT-D fold domain-containing protein [Pontibacillus marinus]|uniref:GT-D fold-like domain-containing protein n=1 Tax=Pontibacillus marinus BH030004 = DSM 16465 TaxID=1385511 RepID=A0A0A5GDS8_9BACI|nr:GT-D fold domain-containing glycosyltransferase [Pontibacillus marinus]KGX89280.1 hypothetical protein N783_07215 [Pontibacillus marinus BH030004 = DSM 16465]
MHNLPREEWERLKKFGHIEKGDEKNLAVEGLYYGGDKLVENKLKKYHYLPYNIEEIISAGMEKLKDKKINLKNAEEIANEIRDALEKKRGYSLVRLGDGELVFLSHDLLYSSEEIEKEPRLKFLKYAGVTLPDYEARDALASRLLQGDAIGIPVARFPTFQTLFTKLVKYHNWDLNKMNLASSTVHFEICHYTTLLHEILSKYKVLLIGNKMEKGKAYFENLGYNNIVGNIPVNGMKAVPDVVEKTKEYDYDVAFVSSGIPANLICGMLAEDHKVAIDFGHAIDWLLMGHAQVRSLDNGTINSEYCCEMAYYYFIRDDFKTAAYWYKQAVKVGEATGNSSHMSTTTPHLQLSVCYWQLGDVKRAYDHNELARGFEPNNPSILQNKSFFEGIMKND